MAQTLMTLDTNLQQTSMEQVQLQLCDAIASFTVTLLQQDKIADDLSSSSEIKPPFSNTTHSDWAEAVQLWNEVGRPLIANLRSRSCPVCCHDEGHRHLFESYDGYPYVECSNCGCWFVPLEVDASLFDKFFAACPAAVAVSERSFAKRLTEENTAADLVRFNGYFTTLLPLISGLSPKHYLDMGCGLGNSLRVALDHGFFEALGLESSHECIRLGCSSGLDIRYLSSKLPLNHFHLISFWESLEHMADPCNMLMRSSSLLHQEGLLVFTVPNLNSPLVRIQRADCSFVTGGFDTPGHINFFSPTGLEALLDRCGMSLLDIDGQYGSNLIELVSYLGGRNRGAADLLTGISVASGLSPIISALMGSIGPGVSMVERITLTTPILFGIACHKSSVSLFTEKIEALREARKNAMMEQIIAMSPNVGHAVGACR